jgi:hypothetical protein
MSSGCVIEKSLARATMNVPRPPGKHVVGSAITPTLSLHIENFGFAE